MCNYGYVNQKSDKSALCQNSVGSFDCVCGKGYDHKPDWVEGDDLCININECVLGNLNHCYSGGNCTDTEGSYTCKCPDGYVGDGRDCDDIDECQNGNHDCDPKNGICLGRVSK